MNGVCLRTMTPWVSLLLSGGVKWRHTEGGGGWDVAGVHPPPPPWVEAGDGGGG